MTTKPKTIGFRPNQNDRDLLDQLAKKLYSQKKLTALPGEIVKITDADVIRFALHETYNQYK